MDIAFKSDSPKMIMKNRFFNGEVPPRSYSTDTDKLSFSPTNLGSLSISTSTCNSPRRSALCLSISTSTCTSPRRSALYSPSKTPTTYICCNSPKSTSNSVCCSSPRHFLGNFGQELCRDAVNVEDDKAPASVPQLALKAFDHLSREVIDEKATGKFYKDILGFEEVPRPALEAEGVWLHGFGLNIHLVKTEFPELRKQLRAKRLEHFNRSLPRADHFAFTAVNFEDVEKALIDNNVHFRKFANPQIDVDQIFLFDPDGNVIELSSCGVPKGEVRCVKEVV
eukprot:CAMPEP_0113934850 /NCGR_PEP_ID=MMETSP1339-20121228/2108_1 /TAXON_ID=94617 /ORGANISM="Fibrocapsa japonica" /LENGTH=280 /DNA_ID=CAMNT_0000936797 /DNA_START=47 /DNA_END=889 /DNA_ORIENTATION=+ /assembly_acc=CAM_ASM_000762